MPIGESTSLEFIYTPLFERMCRELLDDDAMRQVESRLLTEPRAGVLVAATGGVRKLRVALPGRGRRGGARLAYLYLELRGRIYFLLVFAKNERVNLTPADKKVLRELVKQLEAGE
jgi:hypothetical protein